MIYKKMTLAKNSYILVATVSPEMSTLTCILKPSVTHYYIKFIFCTLSVPNFDLCIDYICCKILSQREIDMSHDLREIV